MTFTHVLTHTFTHSGKKNLKKEFEKLYQCCKKMRLSQIEAALFFVLCKRQAEQPPGGAGRGQAFPARQPLGGCGSTLCPIRATEARERQFGRARRGCARRSARTCLHCISSSALFLQTNVFSRPNVVPCVSARSSTRCPNYLTGTSFFDGAKQNLLQVYFKVGYIPFSKSRSLKFHIPESHKSVSV